MSSKSKTKTSDERRLFLCHAHKDKQFVKRLARDLTSLGVHVWLDEWELTAGDSLHSCIGAALEQSAFLGVVLSPDSVESKWCQSELQQGLARELRSGSKSVLPLLCRKVRIPPFLEDRLYADFRKNYHQALTKLAALVHEADTRAVADALDATPPHSCEDVRSILESVGCETISYLSAEEFEQLRKLLKKAGIHFTGDELDILPVHETKPLSKEAAKKAVRKTAKKAAVFRRRLKK